MQILDFEQIRKLVHGAARTEEGDGKISFFRFSKEQEELYKTVSADFYMKSFSTSGISLEFDTDSENLLLSVLVSQGSSRHFFTHSIFVNEKRIGELSGNIGDENNVPFEKKFDLGFGMKRARILFPWSVASSLVALGLDDGAKTIPVNKKRKILMFGDSITQGYDAMVPENAYSVQIADRLGAEARNKGIAAERFFAGLAKTKEDFEPDFITVAYGTNDWKYSTEKQFKKSCKAFFANLRISYPNVPIVAFTPIWRVDIDAEYQMGVPFGFVADYIKSVAESISDMTVIDCIDFIPHNPKYYQTDGVHPIDSGFEYYGKNLLDNIEFLAEDKK